MMNAGMKNVSFGNVVEVGKDKYVDPASVRRLGGIYENASNLSTIYGTEIYLNGEDSPLSVLTKPDEVAKRINTEQKPLLLDARA